MFEQFAESEDEEDKGHAHMIDGATLDDLALDGTYICVQGAAFDIRWRHWRDAKAQSSKRIPQRTGKSSPT